MKTKVLTKWLFIWAIFKNKFPIKTDISKLKKTNFINWILSYFYFQQKIFIKKNRENFEFSKMIVYL